MRPLVCIVPISVALACGAPAKPSPPPPSSPSAGATPASAPLAGATAATTPARPPSTSTTPAVVPSDHLPIDAAHHEVGTAHPFVLRAVDPRERWTVLCQARRDTDGDGKIEVHTSHHGGLFGDAMAPYLILGGGAGTPIDAFVGASPDHRWVAILRGANLELVDSESGQVFAMPDADTESDHRPGSSHRAAAFAGERLLYIRHRDRGDVIVVHDLDTHLERELAVNDRLWRLSPRGEDVTVAYTVPADQGFPQLNSSLDAGECLGAPLSYGFYGQRGPAPVAHWMELESGRELASEGALAAIGRQLVRAPSSGALLLDNDELAPATCQPQVLALLPSPARVIAICGAKQRAKVLLLGKGLRVELATIDRDADRFDDFDEALDPAAGVVCDAGLYCVATATNQRIDLRGGVARYAFGDKLYVLHATTSSRKHEIIDVVSGARTATRGGDRRSGTERFVLDDQGQVIDLESGAIVRKVAGARSVSASGRVLTAASDEQGPLRWSSQ
jgi:hypothetical protein